MLILRIRFRKFRGEENDDDDTNVDSDNGEDINALLNGLMTKTLRRKRMIPHTPRGSTATSASKAPFTDSDSDSDTLRLKNNVGVSAAVRCLGKPDDAMVDLSDTLPLGGTRVTIHSLIPPSENRIVQTKDIASQEFSGFNDAGNMASNRMVFFFFLVVFNRRIRIRRNLKVPICSAVCNVIA